MPGDTQREQRLNEILAAYLEAVEAGRRPDRQALLRRHPDLAAELQAFFDNQDHIRPLAEPFRAALPASATGREDVALAATQAVSTQGPTFGDYELLEEIARGGMGVVYRARQTTLNRVVALKMILAGELATSGAVRRFRAEAEAAAALDHPHIVPIYEVGERQGQQFFSMKLIEGSGLDRQIDRYRADPRAAVRLLAQVARAVQHAHERGILHRDLKPGNILIDAHGEPHVTDFGLAKRVKEDGKASQSMSIVGTASYMAPEQAQSRGPLTVAADVYALGAILYELLTGRPPFKAGTFLDTLIQVVENEPDPPRSHNPRADRDLEKICLKCLQKAPERRYASAGELAAELDNWLAGEPLTVRPARGWERFRRWCRKYPLRAALVVLTAGVLVTAAAGAAWFAWHMAAAQAEIAAARDEALRNADKERAARADADRARDRSRQLLAGQYVANGAGLLDAGDLFGALLWFGEALELEKGEPAAEEAHRTRLATTLRRAPRLLRLWFPDDRLTLARLSPAGDLVLTVGDGQARLFDAATGNEVGPPLAKRGTARYAAFSPDGRRLVVAADKAARLVDPAGRKPVGQPLAHDGAVTYAAFSGDCQRVVTVAEDRTARVWDADSGRPLSKPLAHAADVLLACLSPDGKQAATSGVNPATGNGLLLLWDVASGKALARTNTPQRMKQIAFSADGKHLLTLNAQGTARARKTEAGLPTLAAGRGRVQGGDDNWFDPHKGHVLAANNATGLLWDPLAGQSAPVALPHRADVCYAAFGGNGKWVLTAALDQTARVWDAADGQPRTPPLRHGRRVVSASFSWDGQKLLTCTEDQVLRLWDIFPRPTDSSPMTFKQANAFRAFSPDGRRMLLGVKAALRLTEFGKKKPVVTPLPHTGPVTHGSFGPDGRHVLYVDQQAATVCDLKGVPLGPPHKLGGKKLRQAVFTPDGTRVALVDEQSRVHVWDPGRGEVVATHPLQKAAGGVLAVGPRGERLAEAGSKQDVWVFDTATHQPALRALKHDTAVVAAAFSADGKYLATACADGTARVWDLATATPATPPLAHGRPVRLLAFRPDGRRLATAGGDGLVRVWETATGHPVAPALHHGTAPTHLSFSAESDRLVTADRGSLRVWDLSPDGRPAADLVRLTHLLSGQQAHATSETLVPLGRDRLRQLWEELAGKY